MFGVFVEKADTEDSDLNCRNNPGFLNWKFVKSRGKLANLLGNGISNADHAADELEEL